MSLLGSFVRLIEARLSKGADDIAGKAIYAGAKIVTDQIAKNIRALPIVKGFGSESKPLPGGVTMDQKKGLLETLGIAPMQDDHGYYNVKVGFDGYIETTYDGDVYRQPARSRASRRCAGRSCRGRTSA